MATPDEIMKILDLTPQEYEEMKKADAEIDRGADLFPLTTSQKAVEKKMRQADRKKDAVNAYGKRVTRERKADEDKAFLINTLFSTILPLCEQYEIVNGEREFNFIYKGKKYKIVMSCPRS